MPPPLSFQNAAKCATLAERWCSARSQGVCGVGGDHLEHHQHIARSDGWRPVPVRPSWMNPVETHIGSNEGQGQFLPMLNGYVFPNRKTSQTVKRSSWPFWFLFCLFFDLGRTNGRIDLKTCTARIVIVWYVRVERPTRHIIGYFGDDLKGRMTQPTVSHTEGRWLVNKVKGQSHQAQLTKR